MNELDKLIILNKIKIKLIKLRQYSPINDIWLQWEEDNLQTLNNKKQVKS